MTKYVDGLVIPSRDEAKAMIEQYPGYDGADEMVNPLSYNLGLAVRKGICPLSGFNEKYLYMQALYRKALEHYLSEQLSLMAYDDMLAESELNFIPIREDRKSFYQKYSTLDLKYIYLRSNLPIERLSKDDLKALEACIKEGKSDITEVLLELIIRTYPDIIMALDDRTPETPIGFSNDGQKIAQNNALVFEIGHSIEFDENGNFVNTANDIAREDYIKTVFIPMMETELSDKLGKRVVVFSLNWPI